MLFTRFPFNCCMFCNLLKYPLEHFTQQSHSFGLGESRLVCVSGRRCLNAANVYVLRWAKLNNQPKNTLRKSFEQAYKKNSWTFSSILSDFVFFLSLLFLCSPLVALVAYFHATVALLPFFLCYRCDSNSRENSKEFKWHELDVIQKEHTEKNVLQ